jgi:tRNA (guanine-N7-)-methyltransferase
VSSNLTAPTIFRFSIADLKTPSAHDHSPASLLVELHSLTERLDPARLFPRVQPLEVELGSGDGSFLAEYARRHSERNFIGVERLLGRLRKLDRKGRRFGLTNLRGVRIEAGYFLEYLLPACSITAIHVYFPDPWPKRKHRARRLVNAHFAEIASQALMPGGCVYLRTDDADYFEQITTVFSANPHFRAMATPAELAGLPTDFEKDFQGRGIQTLRAAFQKNSG